MARAKKDKNGYFYEVLELASGSGGKRQRKYIRAKTAGLLKEKIAKFHADQDQGIAPIRDPHEHTLASWLKAWLEGELNISKVSHSTLSDGLNRFSPRLLRRAVTELLDTCDIPQNPELMLIGHACAVDGSEFPIFNGMTRPKTEETVKRVKLQLKFQLNRLVVTDFLLSLTEVDERAALRKMLTEGVTYVLDRGYMAFVLVKQAIEAKAFVSAQHPGQPGSPQARRCAYRAFSRESACHAYACIGKPAGSRMVRAAIH